MPAPRGVFEGTDAAGALCAIPRPAQRVHARIRTGGAGARAAAVAARHDDLYPFILGPVTLTCNMAFDLSCNCHVLYFILEICANHVRFESNVRKLDKTVNSELISAPADRIDTCHAGDSIIMYSN